MENRLLSTSTINENKENITLLWFNPNIVSNELYDINDYIIFYTDFTECVKFIQTINKEKIFLIISAGIETYQLLSKISSLRQIDSIYIYCINKNEYQYLMDEYPKIIGIYIELTDLYRSIEEQIDFVDKNLQTFSIFDQYEKLTKDISKQSAEFLWFQLFHSIIPYLPQKQHMIQICKQYYRKNLKQLRLIEYFELEYSSNETIRWYLQQSFINKLINKALITKDIHQLHIFHHFINELSQNLNHEHEKILLSNEEILTVYRATKIHKEEFNKLKNNQRKLISINGYLLTSRCRDLEYSSAIEPTKRTDVISVLFQIQCHIKQISKNIFFADVAQYSNDQYKQEVLFDFNACFQIESIVQDNFIQVINMNVSDDGQIIAKKFIKEIQQETKGQSNLIVFGRLMCNLGEYDKSQKYFFKLLDNAKDEDKLWIKFNIGRAFHLKDRWKEAKEHYDDAYNEMMENKPAARIKDATYVLNNIGDIFNQQEKYTEAFDYYQKGLKMLEKTYPSGHVDMAQSLNNIGIILKKQGKDDEALDYHEKALKKQNQYYLSGHIDMIQTLNNIANIFTDEAKYNDALKYYQQALDMLLKYHQSDYIEIAKSFNCIGNVLYRQDEYDNALYCHERALEMRKKSYPFDHVDIAHSLNNIGNILVQQKKYHEGLDYHQQALRIKEKCYPLDYITIGNSLNNIGACYEEQNETKMALGYYWKALSIYEKYASIQYPNRIRVENSIHRLNRKK